MKRWVENPMLWVIGTLTLASLPQLTTMALHLALMTLAPIAWRLLAELRNWRPLPQILRLLYTLASLAVLILTYGNLFGRRAAVGLLTVMLALKLLETFRAREARLVASLSLFLCATQFLFSQGLLMVLYGIGVMIGALMSFAFIERQDAWSLTGRSAPPGEGLASELGFSARLMLLAVPLALAVFLLFPRWGAPLWGVPEQSLDAKTGLSTTMTPGSIQELFISML